MSGNQMDVAFERKDVKSGVAYIFMAFVTAMILGAIVAVNLLFAFFTHFEQERKVLTDEVLRSKRVAYHEQVRAEIQKKYSDAIPDNPAEAAVQAKIAFDRISVNDVVRPPFATVAPLEGADILSPLHSGGQPNEFTIGRENILEGNQRLEKAGIVSVMAKLGQPGALKSRPKAERPAMPLETNGGR
jgi:hypothetical protein